LSQFSAFSAATLMRNKVFIYFFFILNYYGLLDPVPIKSKYNHCQFCK